MHRIRQEVDFFLTEDLSNWAIPLFIIAAGIFIRLLPPFVAQG